MEYKSREFVEREYEGDFARVPVERIFINEASRTGIGTYAPHDPTTADIADLVPQALSRLTAWIGQRPVLFAGSIRDNIRFARPEATDDEVAEAARNARVAEFAASLPDGLDTPVGEGGYGLSGGQAQRVAIARAFLKNAPLLLLDEPTAHLDPATEAEVLDSLRRLALGRTVLLASHSAAAHGFGGRRLDIRDGRAVVARATA